MSNYLIGKGELLTYPIKAPRTGPPQKAHPYSLREARDALLPQLDQANEYLSSLSATEAPGDVGVVKFTLHPSYIAKSFFPRALLGQTGLVSVGSKTVRVQPRKRVSARMPTTADTTQLLIAGRRSNLRALRAFSQTLLEATPEAMEFARLETIAPMTENDRMRTTDPDARVFEIALHLLPDQSSADALTNFAEHSALCGFTIHDRHLFEAGGLVFLALEGDSANLRALTRYALLRIARPMPRLRGVRPAIRTGSLKVPFALPTQSPLSREPRVAILDGGLPAQHVLQPYVALLKSEWVMRRGG